MTLALQKDQLPDVDPPEGVAERRLFSSVYQVGAFCAAHCAQGSKEQKCILNPLESMLTEMYHVSYTGLMEELFEGAEKGIENYEMEKYKDYMEEYNTLLNEEFDLGDLGDCQCDECEKQKKRAVQAKAEAEAEAAKRKEEDRIAAEKVKAEAAK